MTRYVGVQYGVMMWGMAFVALFNAVTDLGFHTANMKFIAEGRDQNTCFSSYLTVKLGLITLMVVLSSAFTYANLQSGSIDQDTFLVVLVFIVYFVVQDIQATITGMYDGRLESGKSSSVFMVEYIFRSLLLMALAFMMVSRAILSLAYLFGTLISLFLSIYLFRKPKIRLVRPTYIREYARFAAPLSFSILLISSVDYLDKVLVGVYGGSLEVGFYAASMGVVWAFTSFGASLNKIMLPHLSKMDVKKNPKEGEKVMWVAERYMAMLIFPPVVFLMVLGPEVSTLLFGTGYYQAGVILSYHSIMIAAVIFAGMLTQVLYASGRVAVYGKAVIAYAAVVILSYALLIPDNLLGIQLGNLGGVGAAISLSVGYTFLAILLAYLVRHKLDIKFYNKFWKHLVSAAISLVCLLTFTHYFNASGILMLLLAGAVCLLSYIATALLLGEIKKEDVALITTALNPKKLKESLDDEIG
ncbi:MAG: oligosaccharide flippase family protein [Thermoplasmatales archaeon]|nr:oligosaccharide flippase family protein [Thermoplasmatales archaeon]